MGTYVDVVTVAAADVADAVRSNVICVHAQHATQNQVTARRVWRPACIFEIHVGRAWWLWLNRTLRMRIQHIHKGVIKGPPRTRAMQRRLQATSEDNRATRTAAANHTIL